MPIPTLDKRYTLLTERERSDMQKRVFFMERFERPTNTAQVSGEDVQEAHRLTVMFGGAPLVVRTGTENSWKLSDEGKAILNKERDALRRLDLLNLVLATRKTQDERFPKEHDPGTWLLILTEEIGKAAKIALEKPDDPGDHQLQLMDVVAVALAWLEDASRATYL